MLTRRNLLLLGCAFAVTACNGGLPRLEQANPPKPTLATVTLAISGMTWEGCVEPVRSALLSVKGVSRARVLLEGHEALVEYDPAQCSVEDLITAVGKSKDSATPMHFSATVRKQPG